MFLNEKHSTRINKQTNNQSIKSSKQAIEHSMDRESFNQSINRTINQSSNQSPGQSTSWNENRTFSEMSQNIFVVTPERCLVLVLFPPRRRVFELLPGYPLLHHAEFASRNGINHRSIPPAVAWTATRTPGGEMQLRRRTGWKTE